jgi:hypothetical protein
MDERTGRHRTGRARGVLAALGLAAVMAVAATGPVGAHQGSHAARASQATGVDARLR